MTQQDYHKEAAACARMAEQTDDPTTRMVSAGLAQAWLQLAALAQRDKCAEAADKAAAALNPADPCLQPIEHS
ncbi:MAG TPA: hypothetical protein VNL39_00240 [Xanthobacteraceae bacterium]|nr:hypothetical protein [Xanthobacteraceae bacterium]